MRAHMTIVAVLAAAMLLPVSAFAQATQQGGSTGSSWSSPSTSQDTSSDPRIRGEVRGSVGQERHRSEFPKRPLRPGPASFSGILIGTKDVDLKGTSESNRVGLLRTDDNRRLVVDLGPTEDVKRTDLDIGSRVFIDGRVTRIDDRTVLMAHRVESGDQQLTVDRRAQHQRIQEARRQHEMQGHETRGGVRIQGEIIGEKLVDVRGTDARHQVVLIKTDDGRRIIADLGDHSNLRSSNANVQLGQRISISGQRTHIQDREVFRARSVESQGNTVDIDWSQQARNLQASQSAKPQSQSVASQQDTSRLGQQSPGGPQLPIGGRSTSIRQGQFGGPPQEQSTQPPTQAPQGSSGSTQSGMSTPQSSASTPSSSTQSSSAGTLPSTNTGSQSTSSGAQQGGSGTQQNQQPSESGPSTGQQAQR